MIIAVELNELSACDLAGQIAACRKTPGPVVPAVQHQRGHRNPRQEFESLRARHFGIRYRRQAPPILRR
jgi:hypothetical protein